MKEFEVYVDMTMSLTMYVEAENEEQAAQIAKEKLEEQPYEYVRNAHFVGATVFDVY